MELPSGDRIRTALSDLLRSAVLPEVKANQTSWLVRVQQVLTKGESALRSRKPEPFWPKAVAPRLTTSLNPSRITYLIPRRAFST